MRRKEEEYNMEKYEEEGEEGAGCSACAEARPTGRRTTTRGQSRCRHGSGNASDPTRGDRRRALRKKVGGLRYEPPSPPGVRTPPLIAALPSAKGLVAGPSRSRHQG